MRKSMLGLGLCALLAGCGQSADNSDKFVVGMECNYAPFNWQTNKETDSSVSIGGAGYCDGYDVLVASEIATSLGKELEIKKLDWDGLQPALEAGEIHAIIAGMTANSDREQGIDFTTPYFESEMVLIVRADDALVDATSIQDFTAKNVIGQMNTNYDTIIDQIDGVNHLTPKSSYPELVVTLTSKESDAITAELPVAQGVVEANPSLAIVRFADGKGFDIDTTVSIGLKEGSRDSEFFNSVQSALDNISEQTRQEWMSQAQNNAPTAE
ncbi:MAG TPA: ABC transporter substrate-binding protein [Firmicutes bacterium]|nr:ABC transporter substrate-binding protein [Bacillota bacterium]